MLRLVLIAHMFFRCAPFWRKNREVYPFLAKPQKINRPLIGYPRGVELTRFASFYYFLVRDKLGLHRYTCLVFTPSPALLQNNKQTSDWVGAEENMPPIGTLLRKHLDLSVVELTRCVFRGLTPSFMGIVFGV